MEHNPIAELVIDYINNTDRNIFLTGKAGTGKTTFLKSLENRVKKEYVILASTGVAAIHAGGVTIHSFFQLPFTPFMPTDSGRKFLIEEVRMNNERREIMQHLDLMVIDEISMVRCDILDAVDTLLRRVRKNQNQPFGGVQLLCIGDLYQLPPVVVEEEKRLLQPYYETPYFFSAKALQENRPLFFEFTHIYRQSDSQFITMLNQIRENNLDAQTMADLNQRWDKEFSIEKYPDYIVLCTHNRQANAINRKQMDKLEGEPRAYNAIIQGHFPENQYPNDEVLTLKKGAKVMFIRNDIEIPKNYYNGKIGELEDFDDDILYIRDEENKTISLYREIWENIRYKFDKNGGLKTEVLGRFVQFPIRPAWAVTIHKSQGLTFDRLAIDASDAFAEGQTYVALSRCKSLQGLKLLKPISQEAVQTDHRVRQYYHSQPPIDRLSAAFDEEKHRFEHRVLTEIYDFSKEVHLNTKLHEFGLNHSGGFPEKICEWTDVLQSVLRVLEETGNKFARLLPAIFSEGGNTYRQQRISDSVSFFIPKIEELLENIVKHNLQTDNQSYAEKTESDVNEIYNGLNLKKILILGIGQEFSIEKCLSLKNSYQKAEEISFYGAETVEFSDVVYKDLYKELIFIRNELSLQHHVPLYMVAGTDSLLQMADCLPQTLNDLLQIKGFGEKKVKKYGQDFIDAIALFREENPKAEPQNTKQWGWGQNSIIRQKTLTLPKNKARNTRDVSKQLFDEGKNISEIAKERGLTPDTVVKHLIYFMNRGEITFQELVTSEKQCKITEIIGLCEQPTRKAIKEKAGEHISYVDINIVLSWLQQQKQDNKE